MKIVTIDASAAASWLLPSQRTLRADAFIADRVERRLIAPDVFAWEVGNLIAGRAVTWIPDSGRGRVPSSTAFTDGQGRATTTWTLGHLYGPRSQRLLATVDCVTPSRSALR